MTEAMSGFPSISQQEREQFFGKLFAAAQPDAVYSAPVVSGDHTIITASEVFAAGGFGFGGGSEPAQATAGQGAASDTKSGTGGGGGGVSRGRPVAAVVIGPDGVHIRPIVDVSKLALAAVAAWGGIALTAVRIARQRPSARMR